MGGFVELNAKTNYSFLEGGSHPEEMVLQARELGYSGIAITDKNGVYGLPRSHAAAKEGGFPLLLGAEVEPFPGVELILLAENREGYGNLCELLSEFHTKGTLPLFSEKRKNLIAILPVTPRAEEHLSTFKTLFEDRLYLLAARFYDGKDILSLELADKFSRESKLPVVASNRPLFHSPKRKPLQDTLTCIRHTCTLKQAGFRLLPNFERHLKTVNEIEILFHSHPQWIENTLEVASRCHFSLDELRYRYPSEWLPPGETAPSFLEKLSWEGAKFRYPGGIPEAVQNQIRHELVLIEELQYADYFLTIWDITQFAKSQNILFQGRGSAANSAVCYTLSITALDPTQIDLLFERFISRERKEPPDIDIDFEHERREEVIQYIYRRYGRNRAAITAEVICFRRRSALREVAKVFEIPEPVVKKFLLLSHRRDLAEIPFVEWQSYAPDLSERALKQYLAIVKQILSFPRHLGTHVGGFVLSEDLLTRNMPIENAAMKDRTIVQWDKNDLDLLGFVRVDILGLGILTCIRKCFEILKEVHGVELTLATLPQDPKVYEACSQGDTIGVFQIESRAQMNMLPRLRPKNFYDLVIEISLVRPGPIQGDMVHPYLRRRHGKEKIEYAHPDLEPILKKTFGVPLFQEQIMRMAMKVAGFSPGEADALRRAMGTWRRDPANRLTQMGQRFKSGLMKHGVSSEFAERIFHQIEGFAEYGFPESHAASFALLAYATAYLKFFYPDAYLTAILNSQPMGFYRNHTLIHDGQRHGVEILPVHINLSKWDNRLEAKGKMRLGFREIKGLSHATGEAIQKLQPIKGISDLVDRLKEALAPKALTKRELFLLCGANAFDSWGLSRREALWEIQGLSLIDSSLFSPEGAVTKLPPEEKWERITLDYEAQGLSLFEHPMQFLRSDMKLVRLEDSRSLGKLSMGKKVTVAGIVIARQMPPTASGALFITLEDEFGFINLVVWNQVYQKYREPLVTQSFLLCEGTAQRAEDGDVIHVIVDAAFPLLASSRATKQLPSYDFH
jgi:error-prone DNA polymerase